MSVASKFYRPKTGSLTSYAPTDKNSRASFLCQAVGPVGDTLPEP
jgi:hypothetical protein